MGRGQGPCQTPCHAHTAESCPASGVNTAEAEKPCFNVKQINWEVQIEEVASYNAGQAVPSSMSFDTGGISKFVPSAHSVTHLSIKHFLNTYDVPRMT